MATAAPTPEATDPGPARRWYRLTPGRVLVGLLIAEGLLWLSGHFQWFAFNRYKGWTVLIALGAVAATLAGLLVWFAASLLLRLRFQFSIRSLLLLMTAVAVACSWLAVEMQRAQRQREAVAAIRRAGGFVAIQGAKRDKATSDFPREPGATPRRRDVNTSIPGWLRRLLGEDFFEFVVVVLFLDEMRDGVARPDLSALPDVKLLLLGNSNVTETELRCLAAARHLEKLNLSRCRVTDAVLGYLGSATRLSELELDGTEVTDVGLEHIGRLTQLTQLNLAGTRVSGAGLVYLKALTHLRDLHLNATEVGDNALKHLDCLTALSWLDLRNTHVTDAGLDHLSALTQLQCLDLDGTAVTDAGVDKLRQALPGCSIRR